MWSWMSLCQLWKYWWKKKTYDSDNGNYSEDDSVCDSSDSENLEEL